MARTLVAKWTNDNTVNLLNKLINEQTNSREYAHTMYELGVALGVILLESLKNTSSIALACTVEDADFLAKGIIDVLEKNHKTVFLTVYWNKRFNTIEDDDNSAVAPIIKEFHDENYRSAQTLIIIKSIISSSCIVRTNLTRLIEESNPSDILIVAPVLLAGAIKNLEMEFESVVRKKFSYYYFAEDNAKGNNGMVIAGIGGDIYSRLGFGNQDLKNKFVPDIVKVRRNRSSQSA